MNKSVKSDMELNKSAEETRLQQCSAIKDEKGQRVPSGFNEKNIFSEEMITCISANRLVSTEEAKEIIEAIRIENFPKGYLLIKEGAFVLNCFFLIHGCVRQYQIIDGVDKTTAFYTDGQGISSFTSASKKVPSSYYFECLEESKLAIISIEKELELYKKYPNFESLSRAGMENQLGEYQDMMAKFITQKPEERYLDLLENRPDLINRVPQYHLASYLGVSAETLSRIRKRIFKK
jgi:CRP-like cAMP-binding protein